MTHKNMLAYITTTLAIFIPAPPYVGYGLTLLLGFNIVFIVCTEFSIYTSSLEPKYRHPLILLCSGLITLLYQIGVTFFSPIISLTLGFIMYLIPLSVMAFNVLMLSEPFSNSKRQRFSFKILLQLTIIALFFFFIREFFSFGTISYPTPEGIVAIPLPIHIFEGYSFIWSTIPGAFFLLALIMVILPLLLREHIQTKTEVTE